MPQVEGLRARFEAALEALLAQVRQDPYILAVVLCGSLAHDTVWDKSDIDLVLVTQEVRPKAEGLSLVEDGVPIHASLLTRGAFRKMLQAAIQSSFLHSLLSQGRMVYARDEALAEAFEQARGRLGAADRRIRLLEQGAGVLPGLAKAEKWLRVRGDVHYAFFWRNYSGPWGKGRSRGSGGCSRAGAVSTRVGAGMGEWGAAGGGGRRRGAD